MARTVSVAKTLGPSSTPAANVKQVLFTVPAKNTGLWLVKYIISLDGNETPKVYWYDASENQEYLIVAGKNLGTGDSILLDGQAAVAMKENDEIRIQNSGTTYSVTYLATIELRPSEAIQFHS
ncbi:MAG: hypothetical protein EBX03_10440 [Rhodobacteraceae bacterium]|nr:hypothetical protein [Paracoccaceae bacterium]